MPVWQQTHGKMLSKVVIGKAHTETQKKPYQTPAHRMCKFTLLTANCLREIFSSKKC